jgi:hypothetical protein
MEICTLRDIEGASIQALGDEVREIHVLTSSKRPAKQIVRDIQSLLATRFSRQIDHRVVSVAYVDRPVSGAPATDAREARAPVAHEPVVRPSNGEAARPGTRDEEPAVETHDRIRFVSANVYVSGPRVQAQVELKWRGASRMGSASGWGTRDGAHRLIANAGVAAVQEYFPRDDMALSLEGLEYIRIGRQPIVVVALELLAHREHKMLVGCCSVGQDRQQAIVLATLAALNRVIGSLPQEAAGDIR